MIDENKPFDLTIVLNEVKNVINVMYQGPKYLHTEENFIVVLLW